MTLILNMLKALMMPRIMRTTGQYLPTRPSETPKFSSRNSTPKNNKTRLRNAGHPITVYRARRTTRLGLAPVRLV